MNKNQTLFRILGVFLLISASIWWSWVDSDPKCRALTCNNLDPINQRCDKDAVTIAADKFENNIVELRYSIACDSSWVRADVPANSILYLEDINRKRFGKWTVPDKTKKILGPQFGNMGQGKNFKACSQLPDSKKICTSSTIH
jgi:hypothetical protein